MPRIRSLKPEIHQDEAVGELGDSAFRLFIGLITQADDLGRLKGDPRLIGAQVWPYQPKSSPEIETWLAELDRVGLIQRYAHAGRPFISLPSWGEHQRIDNAGKSRIPAPDEADGEGSPRIAASRREPPLEQGGDQGEDQGSGSKESAIVLADAPLSHLLAGLIADNDPDGKRPVVTKRWVDSERLLLQRDGRDQETAEWLIRWCQGHSFWAPNIRSMPKFREKYAQLFGQAKRAGRGATVTDDLKRLEAEHAEAIAAEAAA